MSTLRIEPFSSVIPSGGAELIDELGSGENGFSGTLVAAGEMDLAAYMQHCMAMAESAEVVPGWVRMMTCWVLNEQNIAIGMVRLRPDLNEALRHIGGNIGYYIRGDFRGRGYGKEMLRLALIRLAEFGIHRALLTTGPDNVASIRILEANGGVFEKEVVDPGNGRRYRRYWFTL